MHTNYLLCDSFHMVMSPYVRTVKTPNGKKAVQVVWETHYGKRKMTQIGTSSSEKELELLLAKAKQTILQGQQELLLDSDVSLPTTLPIQSCQMTHLLDALCFVYKKLGFEKVSAADEVFRSLVFARIIEPTSKLDSLRVMNEVGIQSPSYATLKRRLPIYADLDFRNSLSSCCACHAALDAEALLLFDVTTLYYECHEEDDFRKSGYSKERRLEPQILVALLTDRNGFPLMVNAFEGNRAETKTILPVLEAYRATHKPKKLTVVADAGMLSYGNLKAIEAAGFSFVVGLKIPDIPQVLLSFYKDYPTVIPDENMILTGAHEGKGKAWVDIYQYRSSRARRTLKGIDEQIEKANRQVRGEIPIKRNRFVSLDGKAHINQDLITKTRKLAGWKGYVTNLDEPAEFVIGAYHSLFQIEKSFRMSKHDLKARPVYARKLDSIEAHLSIVFVALALARFIEARTGWSIKKFVRTLRTYRTIEVKVKEQTIKAADPLPEDVRQMLLDLYR